jgi:hypothetical protein
MCVTTNVVMQCFVILRVIVTSAILLSDDMSCVV